MMELHASAFARRNPGAWKAIQYLVIVSMSTVAYLMGYASHAVVRRGGWNMTFPTVLGYVSAQIFFCTMFLPCFFPRIHKMNSNQALPVAPQISMFVAFCAGEAICLQICRVCFLLEEHNSMSENNNSFSSSEASLVIQQLVWFLPKSFLVEVTWDFFFYWTHRLCHKNKMLYKLIHMEHHVDNERPGAIATTKKKTLDDIITMWGPLLLTLYLLNNPNIRVVQLTSLQLHWLFAYKSAVELAGHCGVEGPWLESFFQLPGFGAAVNHIMGAPICSVPRSHDRHHQKCTVNFSKRFSLWDIVFGTFEDCSYIATTKLPPKCE